jgi:predicted dithiol-disulfide oxidoreductase (DUF899 family)
MTVLTESDEYRAARAELQTAEVELREARRRAAALRRALPHDTEVEDYVFEEAPGREVHLSELFTGPERSLIVYQFMYGGAQTSPCPMCSMWIDGLNGVARHVAQRADLVVVAQAAIGDLEAWGEQRGWSGLRLLSSAPSSFKTDLGTQAENGEQFPGLSVFTRAQDGSPRHVYTRDPNVVAREEGGMDQWCVVWNLFDLVPEGRGDWYPSLEY